MKRLSLAASILALCFATAPAGAEDADIKAKPAAESAVSVTATAATPEMWFYQQYQQEYKDPKVMIRKAAELKATERQRRIASLQWFGMSNQRPRAWSDPYNGDYSPTWVSGNYDSPQLWTRPSAIIIVAPRETQAR